MMKLAYVIGAALSLFVFSSASHDVPVATFELNIIGQNITMHIEFDKEDLLTGLNMKNDDEGIDQAIKTYIENNTTWWLNEEEVNIDIHVVSNDDSHYYAKAELSLIEEPLKQITVRNICLIDKVEGHSNELIINNNGQQRGFRLHKTRQEVNITL